jgi:hypothetical protein
LSNGAKEIIIDFAWKSYLIRLTEKKIFDQTVRQWDQKEEIDPKGKEPMNLGAGSGIL